MRVRPADETDIPAMSALATRAFKDAYADSSPADDLAIHLDGQFSEDAIRSEMALTGVRYFVADDEGRLAGLVKLRDSTPPPLVPAATAVEVQQLYVDTALQRGGVGRELMLEAVGEARRARVGGIWLSVWTEADWATTFYRKFGFSPLGELDFYLGNTHYVDYLMWLAVDEGAAGDPGPG